MAPGSLQRIGTQALLQQALLTAEQAWQTLPSQVEQKAELCASPLAEHQILQFHRPLGLPERSSDNKINAVRTQ